MLKSKTAASGFNKEEARLLQMKFKKFNNQKQQDVSNDKPIKPSKPHDMKFLDTYV